MDEKIIENINHQLDDALERGKRIVEDEELADRIDELKARAEVVIRKHPLKSLAAGLAAGYLLGKLFNSDD